jgi:NRAMP (natural resistance-associated macrophage protein)-like metal ion transporter
MALRTAESSDAQAAKPPAPEQESSASGPQGSRWWQKLGPGLITGAADDDPSGIATYSQGGAQFGYDVAWTLLLTFPLMVAIQLASARIGRVTGKGLTECFFKLWPRSVVYGLVTLLVIANVINLGADLNAMGDSASLVVGGPKALYAVAFGIVSLLLQVFLPYERYVKILKWLTLSLLAYVGVALAVKVDWFAALKGTFVPHLKLDKDYITTVVAILGTTISPYLFFWQAAQEVEEIKRVRPDKPLRDAPEQSAHHLRRLRIDTAVGMGFSNLIAFFMIVATAATLHAQGIQQIARRPRRQPRRSSPSPATSPFCCSGSGSSAPGCSPCRCSQARLPMPSRRCSGSARGSICLPLPQSRFMRFWRPPWWSVWPSRLPA